jgi:hypothetical protein
MWKKVRGAQYVVTPRVLEERGGCSGLPEQLLHDFALVMAK